MTPSQQPLQIIFNPVQANKGTFYRTIYPQSTTSSIQDVFTNFIDKLLENNENLDSPVYRTSHLESLNEYFKAPDLETKIARHEIPHYWLQHDTLHHTHFQYKFFQNIILDEDTIPQIKVFSLFILNFFTFNYQLLCEQKDKSTHINFPQVLTYLHILNVYCSS